MHEKIFGLSLTARSRLEKAVIAFVLSMVGLMMWTVRRDVLKAEKADHSPIVFDGGEWQPDKTEYAAGDLARFTYNRKTTLPEPGEVLMLLNIDTFENLDTHEVFPGAVIARIVEHSGTETLHSVRRIPPDCTPGRYVLKGWMSSQTTRRTMPAWYQSKPFTVVAQ